MILTDEDLPLQPSDEVLPSEASALIEQLDFELKNSPQVGVGLAACQIGMLKSAFIIRIPGKPPLDFINPCIISMSEPLVFTGEGCLSYPGVEIKTLRYNSIAIKDDYHPQGLTLTGLQSVVAQHEYQHCLGLSMFTSELSKIKDGMICPCGSERTFIKCCKIEIRKHMRVL